jgi:hypothetical protein
VVLILVVASGGKSYYAVGIVPPFMAAEGDPPRSHGRRQMFYFDASALDRVTLASSSVTGVTGRDTDPLLLAGDADRRRLGEG